jgi:hypothetical protein
MIAIVADVKDPLASNRQINRPLPGGTPATAVLRVETRALALGRSAVLNMA